MTWTPDNNTTIWALLTDEQKEAMKAAKHGWALFIDTRTMGAWATIAAPSWEGGRVYRAKPAPKWEPPAELWALLRDDIVVIARDENGAWWGYEALPKWEGDRWDVSEDMYGSHAYGLIALNLPDIPAEESLFRRPWRKGGCDV